MGSVLSVQEFSTPNSTSGGDDYSITVPANAEALVVTLGSKDAGSVSASLSTDGSLGTPDAKTPVTIDANTGCYIWALASPTTGAQTLTVTCSKTARDQSVKVYYCDGVDTADLVEAVVDNVSGEQISEAITTVDGGIVIDVWAERRGIAPTAGADQTAQTYDALDDGYYNGSYLIADATSETMTWSGFDSGGTVRYAAISLNPSSGGTPISASRETPTEHLEPQTGPEWSTPSEHVGAVQAAEVVATEHRGATGSVTAEVTAPSEALEAVEAGELWTNELLWSADFSRTATWALAAGVTTSPAVSVLQGQTAQQNTNDGGGSRSRIQDVGTFGAGPEIAYVLIENVDADESALYVRDAGIGNGMRVVLTWADGSTALDVTGGHAGITHGAIDYGVGPNGGQAYLLWLAGTPLNPGNARQFYIYWSGTSINTRAAILHQAHLGPVERLPPGHVVTGASPATERLGPWGPSEVLAEAAAFDLVLAEILSRARAAGSVPTEHPADRANSVGGASESLVPATQAETAPAELLSALSRSRAAPTEHLGGFFVETVATEHLVRVVALGSPTSEAVAPASVQATHGSEHLAGRRVEIVGSAEHLGTPQSTLTAPTEWTTSARVLGPTEAEHLAGLLRTRPVAGEHATRVTTASAVPAEELIETLRGMGAPAEYLERADQAVSAASEAGGSGGVFVILSTVSPGNLVRAESYTTDVPAELYRTHVLANRS